MEGLLGISGGSKGKFPEVGLDFLEVALVWTIRNPKLRSTPSTAGNSMTGSERPSPEPILKKSAPPAVLGGREFWKCSGSLKCLEL